MSPQSEPNSALQEKVKPFLAKAREWLQSIPNKALLVPILLLLLPILPKEKSGADFKVLGQLGKVHNQYAILGWGGLPLQPPKGKDYRDFNALSKGELQGSSYASLGEHEEFTVIDQKKTKALLASKGLSESASSCMVDLLVKTHLYAGYMYLDREYDALLPSQVPLVWLARWFVVSQARNDLGQQDISPDNLRRAGAATAAPCHSFRVLEQAPH